MAWYRTGTVAVTNNSDVVDGTGTDWLNAAKTGDMFQGPDLVSYEILQISSPTSLRCYPAYRGPTSAAQNYAIIPTRSRDVETAAGVSQLINNYAGVRDNAGQGKFAAGTAGVPSLRGSADEDTGVNFPGGNVLELIAGGGVRAWATENGLFDPASKPFISATNAAGPLTGGAIMERGSNANGEYVKYLDGTLICTHRIVCQFSADRELKGLWNFPVFFAGAARISAQMAEGGLIIYKPLSLITYGQSGGVVGILVFVPSGGAVSGDIVNLDVTATGRWK